jgi:sigma-B regulation protein RsbU (phosphoserine phosphatase)
MPVFDGGRVLNWTLMFRRDARGFTVDELEQNVLTANLFGAMTRNLVSLEQINRLNEQLRRQFEEVARVQRSLLPKSIPEIPGLRIAASYMPSQQAGGDYYDFFELPGGRLGVMIADVSGHGPAAATVMAMLHAIIHAYPGDAGKATPGEIVAFVNRQLTSANMDGTFATAIVARFDPATRELRYACAGHPPARQVLPSAAGPLVRPLDGEATLPLGIVDELHAPEHHITLEPGQNIVLYTDGITEAFNARREIFGVEGLDQTLEQAPPAAGPQAVIDTIRAALLGHTGRHARDDDQTLVVLCSE